MQPNITASPWLILPGDPEFGLILSSARPPDTKQVEESAIENVAFVADSFGLLRAVTYEQGLWDYFLGGEYEEVMSQDVYN